MPVLNMFGNNDVPQLQNRLLEAGLLFIKFDVVAIPVVPESPLGVTLVAPETINSPGFFPMSFAATALISSNAPLMDIGAALADGATVRARPRHTGTTRADMVFTGHPPLSFTLYSGALSLGRRLFEVVTRLGDVG